MLSSGLPCVSVPLAVGPSASCCIGQVDGGRTVQLVVVIGTAAVQAEVNVCHGLAYEAVALAEFVEAILEQHALADGVVLEHAREGERFLVGRHGAYVGAGAALHTAQLLLGHGQLPSFGFQPPYEALSIGFLSLALC